MTNSAIRVHQLCKRYKLGGTPNSCMTLRDTIATAFVEAGRRVVSPFRRGIHKESDGANAFWSLKDVSFEIGRGEVVGIIGHNGAGKSTLLKILSRITEPTAGYAEIAGRVGSLLEVGTGFHEELSGRENIYLNGAILGMPKTDIDRKFDAIASFAEIDRFLDTPLKHYSSGMYLRLAFSVAAHLEPDVLLVDEVLAVGDLAFQNKCLAKMETIAEGGRTVLFVSHNLAAIKELCQTSIVLKQGALDFRGSAVEGVARYVQSFAAHDVETGALDPRTGWKQLRLNSHPTGEILTAPSNQPLKVEGLLACKNRLTQGRLTCQIANSSRETVVLQTVETRDLGMAALEPGQYPLSVEFPPLWLAAGIYTIYLKLVADNKGSSKTYESGPMMLNITGHVSGSVTATLAPPAKWNAARQMPLVADDGAEESLVERSARLASI